MRQSTRCAAVLVLFALAGCGDEAAVRESEGYGKSPTLPAPRQSWLPTMHIARATGWSGDAKPTAASGLQVTAFAKNLQHPRWLAVLPNGDVLVAESDAPPKPDDKKGIRGIIEGYVMKWTGSGLPSANRITLLRDTKGTGVADERHTFLTGLNSPFGMALHDGNLYVANTDAIVRFPYKDGDTSISTPGVKVADLPAGTINHHWTKDVIVSDDGKTLFASVGSNSNVGENGLEAEERRADILAIDAQSGASRIFASGLRNANGLSWEPKTHALWAVVNERDEIGSDLVPDYMTSIKEGAFYGWPFSYYGQHVDDRVKPQNPEMVAKAIPPDYALGTHTASLGLTFASGSLMPEQYREGAFIGQHGSWNRKPRSGYKVIFVPFKDGMPSGAPQDVLTGFLDGDTARGRPVGVRIDKAGALLVADDVGSTVWRVAPATTTATTAKPAG